MGKKKGTALATLKSDIPNKKEIDDDVAPNDKQPPLTNFHTQQ
jgi:hypothetical protein